MISQNIRRLLCAQNFFNETKRCIFNTYSERVAIFFGEMFNKRRNNDIVFVGFLEKLGIHICKVLRIVLMKLFLKMVCGARALLERYIRQASWNYRRKIWVLHGDIKKCFDSIDHTILAQLLAKRYFLYRAGLISQQSLESSWQSFRGLSRASQSWSFRDTLLGLTHSIYV